MFETDLTHKASVWWPVAVANTLRVEHTHAHLTVEGRGHSLAPRAVHPTQSPCCILPTRTHTPWDDAVTQASCDNVDTPLTIHRYTRGQTQQYNTFSPTSTCYNYRIGVMCKTKVNSSGTIKDCHLTGFIKQTLFTRWNKAFDGFDNLHLLLVI